MALYAFILIGCLGFLVYLILTQSPQKSAALLVQGGPFVLIAAGLLLTLLRRGFIGLPLIYIGIMWWRRTRRLSPLKPAENRKSTVRSQFLEMQLDHDTGELDGRVLSGRHQGAWLSSLDEDALLSFYQEIRSDPESVALLESYLDRCHADWRDRVFDRSSAWDGASESGRMTRQEACEILGVKPDAPREEIIEAWRRLIKRVHPDKGGSAFLSAKINAAKEVLLGD